MTGILEHLRGNRARHVEELKEFLAIPSVSAKSEHRPDVQRAAEWLVERMLAAGLETAEVHPTEGHPIVLGSWRGAPQAPTLLIYGHYDVQPPEPLDEWVSPPFEATEREGKLYARGAVDDKGQLYLYLKAIEAHIAVRGALPVNVVLLVEGEEEVGSPHLESFLAQNRGELECDAVLISDTGMFAPGLPSITKGLRGLAYMEVRVQGPATDLHSGSYGGAVVNPANALARILSQLHDDEGRVTIPGFYDDVLAVSEAERGRMAALPHTEDELREEVGASSLGGEQGFSAIERIWIRPTLDINGLLSGYTGEGAKTVLPAKAMAKVSMRLVPNQSHTDIEEKFARHIKSLAPKGVVVEVESLHGGEPWYADPEHPIFEVAAQSLETAFGKPPVFIREGGSIPIVHAFQQTLHAPVALIGFALPGSNTHAPNEWFSLENFAKGSEAIALLLDGAANLTAQT